MATGSFSGNAGNLVSFGSRVARLNSGVLALALVLLITPWLAADEYDAAIEEALKKAGDNRAQLQAALDQTPEAEKEGMRFLIANMPDWDLEKLSAEFLREHVHYAYKVMDEVPWKNDVPKEVFLNYVLPYSNVDERRDAWRKDFYERFRPLVADIKNPGEAAGQMNLKLFPLLKVSFSTARPKANQSPYETIEAGIASCTGLSILLVDACRAAGIPARFAGTPMWSDKSGNHSWVEIWSDGRWHCTGAAEPAGGKLNEVWFGGRAAAADRDHPLHAIYATRFEKSKQQFPLFWSRRVRSVNAVNVTDFYTQRRAKAGEGEWFVRFRVFDKPNGQRVSTKVKVTDEAGNVLVEGPTRDDRFDPNDHLEAVVKQGSKLKVEIHHGETVKNAEVEATANEQLFTLFLTEDSESPATN